MALAGQVRPEGQLLTQLHVLVVCQHQDDVGPDVSAVPLKPAFQAVVGQERRTSPQQRAHGGGQQAKQEAGRGHFTGRRSGRPAGPRSLKSRVVAVSLVASSHFTQGSKVGGKESGQSLRKGRLTAWACIMISGMDTEGSFDQGELEQ